MYRSSSTSRILVSKEENSSKEFKKQDQIGSGGFSIVYKAVNTKSNQIYAMKVIPHNKLMTEEQKALIDTEIKLHRSLNHSNIVKLYKTYSDQQNQYIILEYCRGGNLKDKFKAKGRFTELEVRNFLHQALNALYYIHSCGIVHRDIKLGNFLYGDSNEIKICDFGLAVRYNPKANYTVSGTQGYLAPELITQKSAGITPKIDVWALGVCAFTLLNGYQPFEAPTPQLQFERIKNDDFRFNPSVVISPKMQDFIVKALTKDPSERPSAEELLQHPLFSRKSSHKNLIPIIPTMPSMFVSCFSEVKKIGLAYILMDGTCGMIFADGYKFIEDPHQSFVQYYQPNSVEMSLYIPPASLDLQKKVAMFSKFSEKLRAQIELYNVPSRKFSSSSPLRMVRKWQRENNIMMFKFDNNDMQFNFNDGMKLIVYSLDHKLMMTSNLKKPGKTIELSNIQQPEYIEYKNRFEVAKDFMKTKPSAKSSILVAD